MAKNYKLSELCIWWVSEKDCKVIGEVVSTIDYEGEEDELSRLLKAGCVLAESLRWPKYVVEEYKSQYGRYRHGTTYEPEGMDLQGFTLDNFRSSLEKALRSCSGIVLLKKDVRLLSGYPGIITDTNLNIIKR